MGGNWIEDDWELETSSMVRTLVLVGRTGNGKSATGNSILGVKAFKSMSSSIGVTARCELQSAVSEAGLILNVIDTPGLFDFSADVEFVGKEIVRCINMAKYGIHSVLVVLSVRSRFTREEEAAIKSLQKFFGNKIMDYMVVVFTGGDDLEGNDETLPDYLGRNCPESLKEILEKCGNRWVLFDNKTCDEGKKAEQLKQLLFHVNQVVENNGGKPFTDDIFAEFKKGAMELHAQAAELNSVEGCSRQELVMRLHEEQMNRISKMVEAKLKEATTRLEQQLAEEQAARLRAETSALEAHMKSNEEIHMLREKFQKAERENEELRKLAEKNQCSIL